MVSAGNRHVGDNSVSDFHAAGSAIRRFILRHKLDHSWFSDLFDHLPLFAYFRVEAAEENPEMPNQKWRLTFLK